MWDTLGWCQVNWNPTCYHHSLSLSLSTANHNQSMGVFYSPISSIKGGKSIGDNFWHNSPIHDELIGIIQNTIPKLLSMSLGHRLSVICLSISTALNAKFMNFQFLSHRSENVSFVDGSSPSTTSHCVTRSTDKPLDLAVLRCLGMSCQSASHPLMVLIINGTNEDPDRYEVAVVWRTAEWLQQEISNAK